MVKVCHFCSTLPFHAGGKAWGRTTWWNPKKPYGGLDVCTQMPSHSSFHRPFLKIIKYVFWVPTILNGTLYYVKEKTTTWMIVYDVHDLYTKHVSASKGSMVVYLNSTFQLRYSTNFKVAPNDWVDRRTCQFKIYIYSSNKCLYACQGPNKVSKDIYVLTLGPRCWIWAWRCCYLLLVFYTTLF